jgi:hypothetical protein
MRRQLIKDADGRPNNCSRAYARAVPGPAPIDQHVLGPAETSTCSVQPIGMAGESSRASTTFLWPHPRYRPRRHVEVRGVTPDHLRIVPRRCRGSHDGCGSVPPGRRVGGGLGYAGSYPDA